VLDLDLWLRDIESLEAISQDEDVRQVFLKLAALARSGGMESFLARLAEDDDLDRSTKEKLAELGRDEDLLLSIEEYLRRTARPH
jgi:hypothetical protein